MNTNAKLVISGVCVAIIFFFFGMKYGQAHAPRETFNMRMGGQSNGGRIGRTMMGGGIVLGTIVSKDAQHMTVSIPGGGSKIVFVGTSTPITKSVTATATDLTVGQAVVITGQTNADGSLTARSIELRALPTNQ